MSDDDTDFFSTCISTREKSVVMTIDGESTINDDIMSSSSAETRMTGLSKMDMKMNRKIPSTSSYNSSLERARQLQMILNNMTENQRNCFLHFFCSRFNQKKVKTLVLQTAKKMGIKYRPEDRDIVAIAGMAKVFVGELTQKARKLMDINKKRDAIEPDELKEAFLQWKKENINRF
ncbi:hypothetical protein WA158_000091 [Blastocystis sp. Blastoise]